MTARTPTYLKGRYEQGDIPQGTDYEDLFDSYVNVATSAEQTMSGNLKINGELIATTVSAGSFVTTNVSATNIYGSFANIASISGVTGNITNLTSSTVTADSINVSGKVIFGSFDVSALATTQASAVLINGTTNFVIFANGNNLAVRLPDSERGRQQYVINAASTTIKIFPAVSGRFLVTAVNASLNIPADKTALVFHKGDGRYGIVVGGF